MKISMVVIVLVVSLSSSVIWAGEAEAMSLPARLEFVDKLINNSSGAKQVLASGVPEAMVAWEEAVSLYNEAKGLGDEELANKKLAESTNKMFLAIKLSKSESVTKDKEGRDYLSKKQSVTALLEALNRIAQEKGDVSNARSIEEQVNGLVNHADQLVTKNEHKGAMVLMDQAYQHVKTTIETMRGGDTLVRSLNFASKEDEYHYELDRNDTHMMLLTVLTKDKAIDASAKKKMDEFVAQAKSLRQQAENNAKSANFEAAVENLEASTKEVVKAIRGAGIYIPG